MTLKKLKRRTFIQGLAVSNCLMTLGWPSISLATNTTLNAQQITERISVISGAGGNVVLYQGDNGVTLIDCGSQENAPALLALVDELSGKAPLNTLFNTHWHEDHTGANELVKAQGAQIIAHENTKLWLGADFEVHWRNWAHKPRAQAALPDISFYLDGKMDLGGETVEYYHFEQAHTDGDIALYFPESNVMVAGGLASYRSYPITDIATGGWIGGLIKANAAMLAIANADTVIIPDQGPALSLADLQAQHDMLSDIYEQMKALAQQGFSGHDMLQEKITSKYDEVWGSPEEFILETYRGMWAHTYDMGGFI